MNWTLVIKNINDVYRKNFLYWCKGEGYIMYMKRGML